MLNYGYYCTSLPEILQMSMDPNTWYVSLPNGLPRISSPIILKRDTTTLAYLANKRSLQGLSLHMTRKVWKLHQLSFARRSTIIKLITGWNVDGSRYALYTSDPLAKATNSRCPYASPQIQTYTGSATARVPS